MGNEPDTLTPGKADARGVRLLGVWLVVLTLIGGALRVYDLGGYSFWEDELNTVRACGEFDTMHRSKVMGYVPTALGLWWYGVDLQAISNDNVAEWRQLGAHEHESRIGSALLGALSIAWLGWASRHLIGLRAAAVFALLLMLAPWHLYWSHAARFYTMQVLFYSLALIEYYRATRDRRPWRFGLMGLFIVLAFLSQPPALLIGAVFAVDWLMGFVRREPVRLGVAGWACGLGAAALCVLIVSLDVRAKPGDWTQFAVITYQTPAKIVLGTAFMITPAVVLLAVLAAWQQWFERPRLVVFLLAVAIVPPLVFAAMSTRSYVALRYAFICLYGWLALAAVGADVCYRLAVRGPGRATWVLGTAPLGLVLTSVLLMNYLYFTTGHRMHPRWADAFAYVAEHRVAGERVLAEPIVGQYYLEEPDITDDPERPSDLDEVTTPAWIVVEMGDAFFSRQRTWLNEHADLRAVYPARLYRWSAVVYVYYYDPH